MKATTSSKKRLILKPSESGFLEGDTARRAAAYSNVREDSSPGLTRQKADSEVFRKESKGCSARSILKQGIVGAVKKAKGKAPPDAPAVPVKHDDLAKALLATKIGHEKEITKNLTLRNSLLQSRLVEMTRVQRVAFDVARVLRDNLLGIPDRVSPQLTVMKDEFEIHSFITKEIRGAVDQALKNLENLPDILDPASDEGEARKMGPKTAGKE
jgi:hypothetical protein